ncbi:MAG: hypothetical protein AAB113_10765 [Candidatus Eisenbacteria bacterium]
MRLFRTRSAVPVSRSTHVGVGEALPPARQEEADAAPSRPSAERPDRVAVIVAHGMGQQAHFETLEEVAEVLRAAEARARGGAPPVTVRIARLDGRELPRAEIRVTTAAGRPRDVHLYESYWAPLTEGRVTTAEVVRFLVGSGLRGMRLCGFLKWSFERYMFDRPIRFEIPKYAFFQFLAVVLVLLALLAINAVMVAVLASRAVAVSAGGWPGDPLLADLTADLGLGLAGIFGGVLVAVATPRVFRRLFRRPRPGERAPRGTPAWVMVVAWAFMLGALASIVATAVALLWHGWAHLHGAPDRLVRGPLVDAVFAGFGTRPWNLRQWVALLVTWAGGGAINLFARRFLLQYVGDVAAYISSHTVSKFAEVRTAIQARSLEVADAVYRARDGAGVGFEYPGVVVVGHSLGSVIAYDALNAMLVRDALSDPPLEVAARTRMFLTFGSPLDKTGFIFRAQRRRPAGAREALAAARQPMILDYRWRPVRWVNIHSPNDWISGSLEYYDDRDQAARRPQWVENLTDPEASTPLAAHNQYWRGVTLAERLYEAVTG